MLEPSDSEECLEYTKLAYELSQRHDTPVFLRLSTRVSHSRSLTATGGRKEWGENYTYKRDIPKYVMTPGGARPKHLAVEARTAALAAWAEGCELNRIENGDGETGVITSGIAYQYAKEALGDSVSYLKLGLVWPLPEKLIRDFAASVKTLYVIEELDSFIEDHCKKLGINVIGKELFPLCGELSQRIIRERLTGESVYSASFGEALPGRPPVMCAGCPHRGVFYALGKEKNLYVSGDIGCYTLGSAPPLSAMDSCVCMGGSIPGAHGFSKGAGGKKTVAVIGDSTFVHSGMTGLVNSVYNRSNTLNIILDNSITGMTGHQQNPTTGVTLGGDETASLDLELLVRAMGITRVRVTDPYDLPATAAAIKEELAFEGPSVLISRRPCALLKSVRHAPPLKASADKCTGCKACLKIGCPALSVRDKKCVIDPAQCVGCTQCVSLCAFGAIGG
jgi:indolepyruvate ferredoxin oxidoreductase alpha subunit